MCTSTLSGFDIIFFFWCVLSLLLRPQLVPCVIVVASETHIGIKWGPVLFYVIGHILMNGTNRISNNIKSWTQNTILNKPCSALTTTLFKTQSTQQHTAHGTQPIQPIPQNVFFSQRTLTNINIITTNNNNNNIHTHKPYIYTVCKCVLYMHIIHIDSMCDIINENEQKT